MIELARSSTLEVVLAPLGMPAVLTGTHSLSHSPLDVDNDDSLHWKTLYPSRVLNAEGCGAFVDVVMAGHTTVAYPSGLVFGTTHCPDPPTSTTFHVPSLLYCETQDEVVVEDTSLRPVEQPPTRRPSTVLPTVDITPQLFVILSFFHVLFHFKTEFVRLQIALGLQRPRGLTRLEDVAQVHRAIRACCPAKRTRLVRRRC